MILAFMVSMQNRTNLSPALWLCKLRVRKCATKLRVVFPYVKKRDTSSNSLQSKILSLIKVNKISIGTSSKKSYAVCSRAKRFSALC